jgi:hypothetical protein
MLVHNIEDLRMIYATSQRNATHREMNFWNTTAFPTATIAEEFYDRENLSYVNSMKSNRT